jgi:hypothetical protein
MEKKGVDIFEIAKTEQHVKYINNSLDSSNFFVNDSISPVPIKRVVSESNRRLNDYDFNLLKEDAYKDISDDVFKLEYKISKIEEELKNIDIQIQTAQDIADSNSLGELNARKLILREDLEALIAIYNDKSVSARITENMSNLFGARFQTGIVNFKSKLSVFTENIMSKLPGPFSSVIELKKSLNKLENISRSVDELMTMNIPYGENFNKYEQLSKFIIRANSIQAEINNYMRSK